MKFSLTDFNEDVVGDGRYTAVTLPDNNFAVTDVETGETVIANELGNSPTLVTIRYFSGGVLAQSYGTNGGMFGAYFRISDQQLFELPVERATNYFEVLDEDTLLYFEYLRRGEERFIQIGAYQLDSGEKQPIVEGIQPLNPHPAIW